MGRAFFKQLHHRTLSDCPTVTVHAGKRFKVLIDSRVALSLVCTSVYNMIEDCYETKILPAAVHLETDVGSSMSSLGKATIHLCIAKFKFSHTFIICDNLLDTDIIFGIDIQKGYSLSYSWDSDKQLFIQREGSFYLTPGTVNSNIAVVKSPLKIPPRHNGIIPVTIKGHNLKATVGYFISNQHINRRLDPSINVIDGFYNIKDRSTLHILVASYTNKHVMYNKGLCIGYIEPSIDHIPQTSINSLTTQRMIDEHVQPNTFIPPLHTLLGDVRKSLNQLFETFKSQFVQDETCTGTTHLTKMQIDMSGSEPVSQRP